MKKIKFFAAALGLMTLAACSNSDDVFTGEDVVQSQQDANAITFGTYIGQQAQTRAGVAGSITTTSLKTGDHSAGFGVFAYYTGADDYAYSAVTITGATGQSSVKPNFMYNQQVQWTSGKTGYVGAEGDYAWAYTPLKYWPNEVQGGAVDDQTGAATSEGGHGGKLSFFAYAPYVASAGGDYGITAMTANSLESDPILTYVVNPAGSDVVDLLWGTTGTNGVNVLGSGNSGVTYNASGTNYQKSILPNKAESPDGYTLNADLTKQKTGGQVSFAFKHALAKVGGSKTGSTTGSGLQIKADLDDGKGAETGGDKETATLITVNSITIVAKAKSAASGDGVYYQTKQAGTFNLANGRWAITSTKGASATAAATTHIINQSGTGTNVAGKLNKAIAENDITYSSGWKADDDDIDGVTTDAQDVYATEAAPLVFIPGTYPELKVTVDYYVRTYDGKVDGGYSEVQQEITKTLTFAQAVELNKQYNLLIRLGLTGVKFTATVSEWEPYDADGDGIIDDEDKTDVYVPINVQ